MTSTSDGKISNSSHSVYSAVTEAKELAGENLQTLRRVVGRNSSRDALVWFTSQDGKRYINIGRGNHVCERLEVSKGCVWNLMRDILANEAKE